MSAPRRESKDAEPAGGGYSAGPRMPFDLRSLPWLKFVGRALLIIASVYVAIFLEGLAADHGRAEDAHATLEQLAGELREDRADLVEIIAEQEMLDRTYRDLLRWLAEPATMPSDSVQEALDLIAYSNRTLYPRRGAWTTMVSDGHLSWIRDRGLVTDLGSLYENINDRIEYNGASYDFSLDETMRVALTSVWDPERRLPLRDDAAELTRLRNRLRYLHRSWNGFYLSLLREYETEVDGLLSRIDDYLADESGGE